MDSGVILFGARLLKLAAQNERGPDNHQVFYDILAFHGHHEGANPEGVG